MRHRVFSAAFCGIMVFCGAARSEVGIELSRDLSATSKGNNLSLNYSPSLNHSFLYDFSNSVTEINLNSALADFEIKEMTHRLGYDLTAWDALTLSLKYSVTNFNTDEARQKTGSIGLYYQFGDLQLGGVASSALTYQVQQVVILGTDYTDEIYFNRNSSSVYLSYAWTKNLVTAINYTQYSYDKNLDNRYALLTTQPFLNRGAGAVANEIGSQLKNSFDFDIALFLSRNWLMNIGVGSAQEYLSPSAKSNNISLGIEYEKALESVAYRIFGMLDVAKTPDIEGTSNSGQMGFGLAF